MRQKKTIAILGAATMGQAYEVLQPGERITRDVLVDRIAVSLRHPQDTSRARHRARAGTVANPQ